MNQAIILILFSILSAYEGFQEAALDYFSAKVPFDYRKKKWWRKKKHAIYATVRLFLIVALVISFPFWEAVKLAFALALAYPFWHDGVYYATKNQLAGKQLYPGGFMGFNNGNALMDFTFGQRLLMLLSSIGLLFIHF